MRQTSLKRCDHCGAYEARDHGRRIGLAFLKGKPANVVSIARLNPIRNDPKTHFTLRCCRS